MQLERFIHFENTFWDLSVKAERLWKAIYEKTFPGSQSHIIMLLQRSGPLKMSEIAEKLQMTAGAITIASDHLIENDYIERQRDKNDRRIIRLNITNKGASQLAELQLEGRDKMLSLFDHVSEEQLIMMTDIFQEASNKLK